MFPLLSAKGRDDSRELGCKTHAGITTVGMAVVLLQLSKAINVVWGTTVICRPSTALKKLHTKQVHNCPQPEIAKHVYTVSFLCNCLPLAQPATTTLEMSDSTAPSNPTGGSSSQSGGLFAGGSNTGASGANAAPQSIFGSSLGSGLAYINLQYLTLR
jgi:hypothetical protein